MDFAPHSDKERKLIIMIMREGIVYQLKKLLDEEEENQKLKINKCIRQLVESSWITEEAAKYAVSVLATAIGIKLDNSIEDKKAKEQCGLVEITSNNIYSEKKLMKKDEILSEDVLRYVLKNCDAIGYKALAANTKIKQLILPENIMEVYSKAFLNCINLRSVILPSRIRNIGVCAFEGCSFLEKIEIAEGKQYRVIEEVLIDTLNKKVLRVENNPNKDRVNIVNGVLIICKKAFDHSPVKSISIPMTVKDIEQNAFYLTQNLERFEVDSKNTKYKTIEGVLHNRVASILVKYPQGKKDIAYYLEETVEEIGNQAFSYAQNIQTITFTSSLKKVGNRAFEYCTNIENIILPGNVEIIGERAFQYCEKMQSIMLSRNIQEIGDCAFYNCISLEAVSIPKNVKRIGNLAFTNCKKLKTITIQDNVKFVGDGVFCGCEDVEVLIRNNHYMETYCCCRGIKFRNI